MSFVDIQSHLDVPTRNFVVHPMTCLGLKVAFFMSSLYGIDLLGLRNPPLSTSLSLLMSPWSLASSSFNKHEVEEQENASNAEEKHPFHGCFLPRDTSTSSSPPSLMDALLPSNVYRKKHVFHSTMLKRPSFKPHLLRNTSGLSMNENDEGLTSPVFYFQKNPVRLRNFNNSGFFSDEDDDDVEMKEKINEASNVTQVSGMEPVQNTSAPKVTRKLYSLDFLRAKSASMEDLLKLLNDELLKHEQFE